MPFIVFDGVGQAWRIQMWQQAEGILKRGQCWVTEGEEKAMSFETIATDELIRIAQAGLGFKLSASSKPLDDLLRIADASKNLGAKITFTGRTALSDIDIKRIEVASQGHVLFES